MVTPLCFLMLLSASAGSTPFGERIPPVSLLDLGRFPTLGACEERIDWLTNHLEWVEKVASLDPAGSFPWWEYEMEVRRRRQCWRALSWALWTDSASGCRLDSLRQLRDYLGMTDYYAGKMPWW